MFVNLPYITLYVFAGDVCLIFYGIDNALLAFVVIMSSSHNIVTSLCCCSVDHFIPIVVILKYDCKPTLKDVVDTCKPSANF